MARKSLFTKNGLKSLFSQSEANLKDRLEKNDQSSRGKTLKFPKLKKKKKTDKGVVVEETDADRTRSVGGRDEELWLDVTVDQSASLYGTAPRSKRVLHASETDLRKPRKFGTFTFSWRKKKKGTDLPLQTSEVSLDCMGHEEQGVSEVDPAHWISSPLEEASGTTKVGVEPPELTHVLTNAPSIHTFPSQAQDSLTDPSPAEEPEKKSFLPLSQESFDDQVNIITLAASMTNKESLGESPGRPTAHPPKVDSEPSLPHTSPLQMEVPQYKAISEMKPVVLTSETVLPRTGFVKVESTKIDELVTGVTPEKTDSCALSPSESLHSATLNETRPCSGSPSSQITITQFLNDPVLSNTNHSVIEPSTQQGNDNLVSDVAAVNANINIPQSDITDVIINSPSSTAELATDIISPNTETLMPECEVIETTVDITAPDLDIITNAVTTNISISKEDSTDAVATSTPAEPAADMISPSPDTLVTTDTANPDSTDIRIPKADIMHISDDVSVTTSDTTVLPSADITVPNSTMSSPTAEIMADTSWINTPNTPTVNQNLTKLCTSGNDKLATDVAVQNTDIANLEADTTDEVAILNRSSKAEAPDMVFNAETHTLECESTENAANITAPNPDIVSDAIGSDINIPKADITFDEPLSANVKVPNPTVSSPSTETTAAITDINILNNSTLIDQSLSNPCTSSDDKLVSKVSIPNADITIPKADVTDALANSTSETAELATDMFFPNTEITMSECKIVETTVNIPAPDPDIISNADSTDITILQVNNTDVIATPISSALEPAAGMISFTTDTLLPECENTQTPAHISDLDPNAVSDVVGPDISISKASEDITFTSADVVATCDTIEYLSPDIVVYNPPMSTSSMENTAATTDINIPVISDESADIKADPDMITNAVSIDTTTHKADVTHEITNSTSSVLEPGTDMISTIDTLLPECEITDTVSDVISNDISISKADVTFTSADVAVDTCYTIEHRSGAIVVPSSPVSTLSKVNAATTDIHVSEISIVDQIAHNSVISDTSADITAGPVAVTTSPEGQTPLSSDIPFSTGDADSSSTDDITCTEADTSHTTANFVASSADTTDVHTDMASSVRHNNITCLDDIATLLPQESSDLSSANVISSSNTCVSGNDFETETCSSNLFQHHFCELDPDPEPVLPEPATHEPAALIHFPQVTDSSIPAPDLLGPDLTSTIASSTEECSDASVSATDGNMNSVESIATSFTNSSSPAMESLICDSNNLQGIKDSDSSLLQGPNTKITKMRELVPSDMYSLSALSISGSNPCVSMPSKSTTANISPLFSHMATTECFHSISATEIQEAMEKEQECAVRIEDHMDYEADSPKTRANAPTDLSGIVIEVSTNETKDGESVETTCKTLLGSVEPEKKIEPHLSFDKSSGVDEHLAMSSVLEEASGFVDIKCVQSTEAPLHLEDFLQEHKGSSSDTCHADNTKVVKRALVDVATTDTAKQSKTELASVTDMMAAVEHFVSSPQKSHSVREKSYATNPPMNDERAGVDGDRHGVIADIPQCLNLELNTVHSEPSDLEAPRVALQSFDKKQHRQTEDAFIHVTDKGVVVRPEESTAIRHVEVSESIVLVQVQQRGVDQKEIPKEMSDGNCSMDREGYGQQEALFQTVGKVKQEKVEVGMSVHGSIIPSLEPATPVSQVCKPAECDPAQELGKERVLGVILNSFCLAKFPDRGAEPLPQALGEITKNECHNSMGAESTNNLPETQPQLIQANAGQMPLGNTQLLDTKTQTQLMEEEAHMPQAVSETPFTYADTIHSTQTLGQGSHARLTLSQPHGSTNSHTVTTESTSVVLIRAETETEAAVPCKVEPDGLTVNTTNLTDTGRQKLHRPVIIVQRAAGPSEPQTSADTTDFSLSTMEVSRATFTFSSLSTPETKDLSPVHVASNTYTFSSSSTPESKDGKQCHKVSIAGIPETSERTIRSVQPISPTLLSDEELSDRMKARYLAYQYKPNPGVRAFPFTETLDNHNQGVSSALSYSSFYSSSSAVPEAVPLEPARYTPHRFSSERREQPDTQPTSPTPASPSSSSPSNQRSWLSDRAEVQPSEPGGRSWVGLAQTPAGESSTEGGRETESVSERQGERGLYSGSDTRVLLNHSSSSSHSSVSINSSGSSWGPASPTVQLDGYSGVFKATRVELTPSSPTSSFSSPPTTSPISTSPLSPQEPVSPHLETLKDTLKTMEKPARPRSSRLTGAPSLPPIKEDTLDSPAKEPSLTSSTLYTPSTISASRHTESLLNSSAVNGNVQVSLPANLGLNWNTTKDMRSPLTLMKLQQQQIGLNLPPRASTVNSIVMRSSSFGEDDAAQLNQLNQLNGNAGLMSPSRLDNSLIFSSGYQPQQQQVFQPMENGLHVQRTLFRTGSLPETGSMTHERISSAQPLGLGANTNHNLQANLNASRIERLSFLASPASSITLDSYSDRMSMPPTQQLNPLSDMNIGLGQVGQTNPLDALHHRSLQRTYSTDSALGSTVGTPLFNDISNGRSQQTSQPEPEPAKHMPPKYRAFPDAYLTKEKEHGKLNPRPGKMIIYDQPGMKGERIEVRGDVVDATGWDFPDSISLRIIRGGWVLYEKPSFKGEKIALDEGDIETLSNPFDTTEEAHEQNGQTQNGEANKEPKTKKFVIGSIRRAVRDYSVPEISLFPEENAEGKKVVFRDTSEDARIFGFPIKANSIIINAGLWLVYAEPFFQGIPRVLEVGGFTNPAAWGVTQPYVSSLHPLKIGEPRVEKPNEPKLIIYDKPYFTGKSRELYTSMRDFMTRVDRQQKAFMYNAGSLKVIGGIWVGYEKEGFRGKQYLLEEGEYQDWRVWGGCDAELRSVRVIRADLTDPALVMYEFPDEQGEEPQDERTFEVTEAIPDVELFGFHTNTRSIHVLSGAWVAYSHVDFSGNQFILEKGFYNNFADWGAGDNRICSLQPILMAPSDEPGYRNEVMLYSDTDFQGNCKLVKKSEESLPESFIAKSCRVVGSSWVLYEGRSFAGNLYTVCEGDYPNLNSMGCPTHCIIRSIKPVPVMFAVPSISLFGLENFEGREITVDMEVLNLLEAGFNNHVLSVRVNSGCWVVCEHSNYRGRQFLLEPIEVTSWQKFSELTTIGSMYPIREKRRYFRVKNKERGHYLSIQGGVEDMKTGRVVVMPEVEGMSDIWYYQDGLLKNKLSPTTSLQVMGNVEPGAKVVLWNETRMPIQIWSVNLNGTIVSTTFPGMVLDIKGGKAYDRDHVVIREESEEHPCQHWELELM